MDSSTQFITPYIQQLNTALIYKGYVDSLEHCSTLQRVGNVVMCGDEAYVYTGEEWVELGISDSDTPNIRIKYPEKCKYCGATLHDYVCEYCGSENKEKE